jgi:hypothetical protein
MAYTDATAVKTYLGVSGSGDDTLIGTLITAAQAAIDQYYLRTFEASTNTTRYFDAVRDVSGRRLTLDRDLCSINSITNGDGTTVTSAQYVTYPRNDTPYYAIQILASSGVNWQWEDDPEGAIAISGKWAYSTTAPDAVVYLCKWLAAFMYRAKDNVPQTGGGVAVASALDILAGDVPADIRIVMSTIPRRAVI